MSDDNETTEQLPEPPDDFGAALLAEFEKRGTTIPDESGEAPPGGWPGGATADAADLAFDIESAAKKVNAEAVQDADAGGDSSDEGESQSPGDASEGTPPANLTAEDGEQKPTDTDPDGTDGEGAGDADGEQQTQAASPASGYTWQDGDQSHTFTDDEVRRGLMLNQWANSLPEQTRTVFAAIEQGQAVAVSREDYEKFTAFKAQQEKQTRDADLSNLADIDPDIAQVIAQQRDEIAQLKQQFGQQQQPGQYGNLHGNLDNTAQQIDAATRTYASAMNIPVDQAEQLLSAATNSGVFRHFAEAQAQRHPMSGQVVAPPNWNNVVRAALDYARQQIGQQQPQQQQNGQQQNPAPPTSQNNDPNPPPDPGITAKKARAASVASAPSGATPKSPTKTANMTQAQRIQAMADEIAAAQARS